MGIDVLTHALDGHEVCPRTSEDWATWASAGATREHALEDPLLDWLDLYGRERGFQPDAELPGYNSSTNFSLFVLQKGLAFEAAVVRHLSGLTDVVTIAASPGDTRDLDKARSTFTAMQKGTPIIAQGVLWDAETRTYGAPDLLVRSDWLMCLLPGAIDNGETAIRAPDLDGRSWHYRVVDIKFTTLHFLASGQLEDGGTAWAYKLQIFMYNRALGRLQGYLPPVSYLLGRGWTQPRRGETLRGDGCMDRLAPVPQEYESRTKGRLAEAVEHACQWIRRVRAQGRTWQVLPQPTAEELYPNMGSTSDQPWHVAKQRIGRELEDLTLLWQVGVAKRREAHNAGVVRWTDTACNAAVVGVTGAKQAPVLDAMLAINRATTGPSVLPARVTAGEDVWRPVPPLEFYVDFETVTDLDDDFTQIPRKGGQPLIFMIGCGHVENGVWRFSCFTAAALTLEAEATIIDAWVGHMETVRKRLAPGLTAPVCFHWSPAEVSSLETAYNAATQRHTDKQWPRPRWFDFLGQVVKAEPVVVRGALGFGLKAMGNALHALGKIQTRWEAGPADGLGAMVGAWRSAEEVAQKGISLVKVPLMGEIAEYNEVDCKVMLEIISYVRTCH